MKAVIVALALVAGCGGKHKGAGGPGVVATVFPAARWVPAKPTYVISARSLRGAQHSFVDAIDTFGIVLGMDAKELSEALQYILQVDPLNPDAVGALGIDLEGSTVVFSESVEPTFVVHVTAPAALQAFLDKQRERGLVTQSMVVDGAEVFSAKLGGGIRMSWVLDKDWLWVHVASKDDGTAWFEHSRHPTDSSWVSRWEWADKLATKAAGLTGFVDLRTLAGEIGARVPEAAACAQRMQPINSVGLTVEGEGNFVAARLAVDLGTSAQRVGETLLAPPPGWFAAATHAPLAAQWNVDLQPFARWFEPCAQLTRVNLGALDELGARSARAFVHTLDFDDKSGVGAVAFDLVNNRFFARQLDQIPLRSKFERNRAFGAYKGKHLSVPFVVTADYVLDDHVMIAAMGDGVLDKVAKPGGPAPVPVFALDLVPRGLPAGVWESLLELAGVSSPKPLVERLQAWNDIHFGARIDRDAMLIEASGNRR